MPKFMLTVPETELSVTRPVILDITRQIMQQTGISNKTHIFFPGDHERGPQPNSLISESDESDMFPFNDRVSIEVDESFNSDRILSEAVYEPEHLFIFRDDATEIAIKPVYSMADITINVKYRAKDKPSGQRWVNDLRTRIGMRQDERFHKVDYHYMVPGEMVTILRELHRMREAVEGYGESFERYLEENASPRLTIITNLAGQQGRYAISESQQRIIGYFDFDGAPEKGSKEDDGDTWTVSFSYKFSFEKPIACVMAYPLVIHNQLVEQAFRPNEPFPDPEDRPTSRTASMAAWEKFEVGVAPPALFEGIAVPHFDEFLPASVPFKTKRLVTMMTLLDPDQPGMLVSADEINSLGINPIVLHFMRGEATFMNRRYQSIFQIDLYQSDAIIPQNILSMSKFLQISHKEELSMRKYYHVRLSVVEDLRLLPKAALERLRHNGRAAQIILEFIAPWLAEAGLIPKIIAKDTISLRDLETAIDSINSGIISAGNGEKYQFNTVNSIFVQAFKRSE